MKNNNDSKPSKQGQWKVPEVMATVGPTMEKEKDLRQAIQMGASWFRLPCGYRQRAACGKRACCARGLRGGRHADRITAGPALVAPAHRRDAGAAPGRG